jgi:nicotinate-nucleotide pyrophosphorylase (carboxylating)
MFIPRKMIEEKLRQLLAEDVGQGDVTTAAVVAPNVTVNAEVVSKEAGVAAGIEEATILCEYFGLTYKTLISDGEKIRNRQILIKISGNAQSVLTVERTMLNILSRMSGIATKTNELVEKLEKAGARAKIAATRKSAPGLLFFDKKAVLLGGGDSHRLHLDDMVLIKDNHIAIIGSIEDAVKEAKAHASFTKKIEVEVTSIPEALTAAKVGADIIMLDNFSPKQAKAAVESLRKSGFDKVLIEISGGITSENLLEYAASRVDILSLGELTHSVTALDMSLEIAKNG